MAKREVCGNDYDKSFSIEANGRKHVFIAAPTARQAGVSAVVDRVA